MRWRLPEEVVGHLTGVRVGLHGTLLFWFYTQHAFSIIMQNTLAKAFFQVLGKLSCLFLELLEQKNSFAWDSVSHGAGIPFLAGAQWSFPVIFSRQEHARFLMTVTADVAKHIHGQCHSGSLTTVNSRRAACKMMKMIFFVRHLRAEPVLYLRSLVRILSWNFWGKIE